jgi:asparagine synthase (glutamine-hydrolysing)
MGGIAGAKGVQDNSVVRDMLQALKHRGPDGTGLHSEGDLHIGARRLEVLDIQSRSRPVFNEGGDKSIVFDGEIYNYRALRSDLKEKGHIFTTESETEVILHLYDEYGEWCVDSLHGLFAFAIADGRRLFLARDRLGIKPLYYTLLRDKGLFLFASEIKALLQCQDVAVTLDMKTLADSLVLNYAVGGRTFFENIQSFPAGCTMMVSNDQGDIEIKERQYYRVSVCPDETRTLTSAKEELTAVLGSAVAAHLNTDVEVGITLSGGLDSCLLALLMKEYRPQGIEAFTISDHDHDADLIQARWLAARLKAHHHIVDITFEDYVHGIPSCIAADEQPSPLTPLTSLPLHLLCRRVSPKLRVCLSGEGADALFGGYSVPVDRIKTNRSWVTRLATIKRLGLQLSDEATALVERIVAPLETDAYLKNIGEVQLQDQLTRNNLEMLDKHSMAAGIEWRLPYLDDAVVEFATSLPMRFKNDTQQGIQKYLLKRWCLENYGLDMFDIVMRRKVGFPMAGSASYRRLLRFCQDTVAPDYLARHELGRCFTGSLELLAFEIFCEVFIKYRGFPPADFDALEFMRAAS